MAVGEQELAVVLQASLDHAKELLEEAGGFTPFGTRANLDGAVEFLEAEGDRGAESVDALYHRIGALLAEQAGDGEILAAALVANASLPGATPRTAISVQVEGPGFCRSIVIPYRFVEGAVEIGRMIPEEAEPAMFTG